MSGLPHARAVCFMGVGCGWLRVARGLTGPTCRTIHHSFLPEFWMRIATSRISLSSFFLFSASAKSSSPPLPSTPTFFPKTCASAIHNVFLQASPPPLLRVPIFASNQTTNTAFILTSMFVGGNTHIISQAEMSGYCAIMSTSAGTWRKCVLCHKVINDQ